MVTNIRELLARVTDAGALDDDGLTGDLLEDGGLVFLAGDFLEDVGLLDDD